MKRGLLVAGDLSGVLVLLDLIKEVKRRNLNWKFIGSGTQQMAEEGVEVIEDVKDISVTGFTEIKNKWNHIRKFYTEAKRIIEGGFVDFVLLVDYPGVNVRIGKLAHRYGIPVFYYIPPQVWAWRPKRAEVISKFSTFIFVIFPFEMVWFERYGGRVKYVGNPVLWRVKRARKEERMKDSILFMPGSRENEFYAHLPVFLATINALKGEGVNENFRILIAETIPVDEVPYGVKGNPLEEIFRAKLTVSASGTAVLESFLAGVPSIVVYKTSVLTYILGRCFAGVDYISIPNIIFREQILPEYIQRKCRPSIIKEEIKKWIGGEKGGIQQFVDVLREYLHTEKPPEYEVVEEIEKWV